MGAPKEYTSVCYSKMKLLGKPDIGRAIKKNIPFSGYISSVKKEQRQDPNIINVLHKAASIIYDKKRDFIGNIPEIYAYLKAQKTTTPISKAAIDSAFGSRSLQNRVFTHTKKSFSTPKTS